MVCVSGVLGVDWCVREFVWNVCEWWCGVLCIFVCKVVCAFVCTGGVWGVFVCWWCGVLLVFVCVCVYWVVCVGFCVDFMVVCSGVWVWGCICVCGICVSACGLCMSMYVSV